MANKTLQAERCKIFSDFYNNIIPTNVPLTMNLPYHLIAEYGGLDPFNFQYDYAKLREPVMELAKKVYSDGCICFPVGVTTARPPALYQLLGSQSFVMGKNGFVQHPEVSGMKDTEYQALIENPFDFLVETVMPRQYTNLDFSNPIKAMAHFTMAHKALDEDVFSALPWYGDLIEANDYYPGAPLGSMSFCEAPFDFIADQLRGFSGMSMDIRRHKAEIKEAVQAVLPLMFHWGLPAMPHAEGCIITPLHMPTFMREKDFAELWFPTYKTMLEQFAARGARVMAFCEDDWTRYLDYLQELPAGTHLMFEYGDPKSIKDKLGDKFMLHGLYPVSLIKQGTKQECIDKAKELLDIMMPGGGYIFGFDKDPLTLGDVNLENLIAVSEFVHEYGTYSNAGEPFGKALNSEEFIFSEEIIPSVKSKYLLNITEFKTQNPLVPDSAGLRLEQYSKTFFDMVMNLLA